MIRRVKEQPTTIRIMLPPEALFKVPASLLISRPLLRGVFFCLICTLTWRSSFLP